MEAVLRRRGFLRSSECPIWTAGLPIMPYSSQATGAALSIVAPRIPFARPRTAVRSGSCVGVVPRNLTVLHNRLLRWFAVRCWARSMRSRMGELCFAAHARHAEAEMRTLARDVIARVGGRPGTATARPLLEQGA
jgi:hypothetical protein